MVRTAHESFPAFAPVGRIPEGKFYYPSSCSETLEFDDLVYFATEKEARLRGFCRHGVLAAREGRDPTNSERWDLSLKEPRRLRDEPFSSHPALISASAREPGRSCARASIRTPATVTAPTAAVESAHHRLSSPDHPAAHHRIACVASVSGRSTANSPSRRLATRSTERTRAVSPAAVVVSAESQRK